MSSIDIKLTGVAELDKLFNDLPKQLQHRVMAQAHADSAKPLVETAQSLVRKKTGKLRQSIGVVKVSQKKTTELGAVLVGPRRMRGRLFGYHGHLIEYGHWLVRGKRNIRFIQEYPFMRPAFQMTKEVIGSNIANSLAKKMVSFMKRTVKSSGSQWIK